MVFPLWWALLAGGSVAAEGPEPLVVTAGEAGDEGVLVSVRLSDGQVLVGRVDAPVEDDGYDELRLRLADGKVLLIPAELIDDVARVSPPPGSSPMRWGPDPNRSRYLYSPTAFSLGQGNGYVAQRALVLTTGAVGLFDFLDAEVGVILPALFTSTPIASAGLKLAAPLHDKVRVGAGMQAFLLPVDGLQALGFVFGNVTYGTVDSHVTLAGGGAFAFTGGEPGGAVATVSANHRLGPKAAFVTENWFVYFTNGDGPWGTPVFVVPSGGVRLFGPSFAVDLAVVPVFTGADEIPLVPIPWVSFAYNFSLKR